MHKITLQGSIFLLCLFFRSITSHILLYFLSSIFYPHSSSGMVHWNHLVFPSFYPSKFTLQLSWLLMDGLIWNLLCDFIYMGHTLKRNVGCLTSCTSDGIPSLSTHATSCFFCLSSEVIDSSCTYYHTCIY